MDLKSIDHNDARLSPRLTNLTPTPLSLARSRPGKINPTRRTKTKPDPNFWIWVSQIWVWVKTGLVGLPELNLGWYGSAKFRTYQNRGHNSGRVWVKTGWPTFSPCISL